MADHNDTLLDKMPVGAPDSVAGHTKLDYQRGLAWHWHVGCELASFQPLAQRTRDSTPLSCGRLTRQASNHTPTLPGYNLDETLVG